MTSNPGKTASDASATAQKRGFAAMNQQLQRAIASKGGQAAHQKGTAHEFDSKEARLAGQKGGMAVSRDREHMAEIGRKGGESRQAMQRAAEQSPASIGEPSSQQTGAKLGAC